MTAGLALIDQAVAEHAPVALFALFSGGHDSLVNTYLTAQHPRFSGVVHLNTGIGIEETREFVRETCRRYGWPLIELWPQPPSYDEMCLLRGMPGGPKHHEIMYHRLKHQPLRQFTTGVKRHRLDRIILSTGIRTQESTRRMRLHADPGSMPGGGVTSIWIPTGAAGMTARRRSPARSRRGSISDTSGV